MGYNDDSKYYEVLNINDKLVRVLTLGQLAVKLNRSVKSLRIYETRGVLPRPNYYKPTGKRNDRIYTEQLADDLAEIFKGITQGSKITNDQTNAIIKAFRAELDYINS